MSNKKQKRKGKKTTKRTWDASFAIDKIQDDKIDKTKTHGQKAHGLVLSGLVWSGPVWSGLVWSGLVLVLVLSWTRQDKTCLPRHVFSCSCHVLSGEKRCILFVAYPSPCIHTQRLDPGISFRNKRINRKKRFFIARILCVRGIRLKPGFAQLKVGQMEQTRKQGGCLVVCGPSGVGKVQSLILL
jgi:hypothetical protein